MSHTVESTVLFHDEFETPVGRVALLADAAGRLRAAGWTDGHSRMERLLGLYAADPRHSVRRARNPGGLTAAITAYFEGELAALDGLPAEAATGTPFQRLVWRTLRSIPLGATVSYGELARRIGNPSAVRAVGLANGSNPIAIVVPCHRVIGSDGSLTGYAGGLARKRWLLAHEKAAGRNPALPFII